MISTDRGSKVEGSNFSPKTSEQLFAEGRGEALGCGEAQKLEIQGQNGLQTSESDEEVGGGLYDRV